MQPILHNLSCEVMSLTEPVFYTAGHTDALRFAETILKQKGLRFAKEADQSVTHLLLPVPSFEKDGSLKGGGSAEELLSQLSPDVTVYGGLFKDRLPTVRKVDLLDDPIYVTENARITAHCAVRLAMQTLPVTLWNCPVLVIGWGRIGKCLGQLLKAMGALVTVAARKASDRAMLSALGYDSVDTHMLGNSLSRYRVIFNTVPVMLLSKEDLQQSAKDCLKFELASQPGMDGEDIRQALGLPGKYAPETSGELIAQTVLRLLSQEGV